MKKDLFRTHLLLFAVFCGLALVFASCANEDVAQGTTGKETENDKNLTTFVAGDEAKTRTSMDYTTGDFFWEAGDHIYVQDDNNVWQKSSNAPTTKVATFKFMMPGKYSSKTSYKVYYPGKSGSNNQVTIPTTQTQKAPDTTIHFGESGDCGTADATKITGKNQFEFSLDHQAAYLVFQPYTSNTILHDCFVTKIEVTATDGTNIAGTYPLNTTTGQLSGNGSSKQITLITQNPDGGSVWSGLPYAKGFPLNTSTASVATNGAYMMVAPGKHALRVVYWIHDYTTGTEGTITKQLPDFTYAKNNIYDMTANLDVPNYDCRNYYMWDAKKKYWDGHEWDSADPWQPATNNARDSRYPKSTDADKYYNPVMSTNTAATATNSCAGMPNVNEMVWYVLKGNMHWDNSLWTTMGHLYSGGVWIKKKAKIIRDEGITPAIMESQYTGGYDYRTYTSLNWVIYWPVPYLFGALPLVSELASTDDYFYLPALGRYEGGTAIGIGSQVVYWSSSSGAAGGSDNHSACYLAATRYGAGVARWNRYAGARVEPWFK